MPERKVVVGKDPAEKRLKEIVVKKTKTQTDVQEEILLRLKRIEQALGIS